MTARLSVVPEAGRSAPPRQRPGPSGGHEIGVPPNSLVVLAGLPGAGKTTLLLRLHEVQPQGVRAIDSEEVAARLRRRAGRVPYRLLRPAVHALHLLRVLRGVRSRADCVLTTDPMTSPLRRALLRAAAAASGRSLHVVLVDATAAQAREGQRSRGRALGHRRMTRHVTRAARLRTVLEHTGGMSFVDDVLVLPRPVAATTDRLAVGPTRLSLRPRRRCAA